MKFLKPLVVAILFSFFLYLDYFVYHNYLQYSSLLKLLNTFFALISFYFLLTINKKELFYTGFLISILWFWWIGYSFAYYDLQYLVPFVLIAIGLIYGGLFYIIGLFNNIIYKGIYLFILSFIYPFGFNWLQLELLFVNSYISTAKIDFALVILSLIAFISFKNYKKIISLIPLVLTIHFADKPIKNMDTKIWMANTKIAQNIKWDKKYLNKIIRINLNEIDYAIQNKYELVVLPETSIPLVLNKNKKLLNILKKRSKYISIITGSLDYENGQYYNATYLFKNQNIKIAHKVVLIPFGEAIPLPETIKNLINNIFYNGAKDYTAAKTATDFLINNTIIRSAICYEATTNKIFTDIKGKYMIAISNNGWFTPSIQPNLQALLMKYYAIKYKIKIYSISNMTKNSIIN